MRCPFVVLLGEDAVKFESLPDEVVVAKALSVLRSIFGDTTVPEVSVLYMLVGLRITTFIGCTN